MKFFTTAFLLLLAFTPPLFAGDPLPSWNDGRAKRAIIEFVERSILVDREEYLPIEERIATFDQDGTLWTEKPIYTQFAFAFSKIKEKAKLHPEWKKVQPYKAVLSGNLKEMELFREQDIVKIMAVTHANLSTVEYHQIVSDWLKTAKHPRFEKLYTELIYQPMLELIQYLKENQFKVYIVSGGGQDFIRAYSVETYGIPLEQIIGSAARTHYKDQTGKPVLIKLSDVLEIDDKEGKPEAIHLFIGKKPAFAAGNSDGDKEMLEWSQASKRKSLQILVHHDDPVREYAYDTQTRIGTFSEALKNDAIKNEWIIISMKNDWKKIFPFDSPN